MAGYVIDEDAVAARTTEGDTASTRVAIDASCGCERLEQKVIRFRPGRSQERILEGRQEVLYVAEGSGTLHVNGEEHALEPEMGVYLTPDDRYAIENDGPEELLAISVTAPQEVPAAGAHGVTVRYADQPVLPASPNREFRYLVNQDAGCLDVTQFVGVISPGKAPEHSHTYDEVVYILEGTGTYHIAGQEVPMAPGTCLHLPPYTRHCLENSGTSNMKVLGVFHPSGDPASRA